MSDADPNHALRHSLAQLRAQLASVPRPDEPSRQRLHAALADIERVLGKGEAASAAPHDLEALAVGFEVDHPNLAANLRQFIDLLGRAGL